MRLFIAVNFSDEIKQSFIKTMDGLRKNCIKGNFTFFENLHMTLVFLGEINESKVQNIKDIMDKTNVQPFTLVFDRIGTFRQGFEKLLWTGTESNENAYNLNSQLYNNLKDSGFIMQENKFQPHITLARRVVFKDSFNLKCFSNNMEKVRVPVFEINLMHSYKANEKQTYIKIYSKALD